MLFTFSVFPENIFWRRQKGSNRLKWVKAVHIVVPPPPSPLLYKEWKVEFSKFFKEGGGEGGSDFSREGLVK